jgi:Flagellar biosynthesis protein, FliO
VRRALALAAFVAALAPGLALADGIAVHAMKDHLEITVPGAKAAGPSADAHHDFVEVRLATAVKAAPYLDASDATLKKIEITEDVLRIQLHHSQDTTKRVAAATRIISDAAGLHVSLPRKEALASWAKVTKPEPEPEKLPAPATRLIIEGPPAPAAPAKTDPPPAPGLAAPAAAPPAAPAAAPLAIGGGKPAGPPTSGVLLVLGICAAGGGLVLWARKRRPAPTEEAIRVIASRGLGGKARVVLLAAGERELLLSVSDKGNARLIGRWRRGDTGTHAALDPVATNRRPSPSVSGLIKLRALFPGEEGDA